MMSNENRREFLLKAVFAGGSIAFLADGNVSGQSSSRDILDIMRKNAGSRRDCGNWCGSAHEAPDDVTARAVLADENDEGDPLLIQGTVYEKDGKTPAPNVLIYAYHTNAQGFYGRGRGEHPHGRHHGWMLTDRLGHYQFRTIKPAQYPARDTPAHIHYTLTGLSFKEYWIDDIWFEGDDLITPEIKKKQLTGRGGFDPILKLEKGANGIWVGRRDIRLWNGAPQN